MFRKKKNIHTLDGLIKGLNYALNAADQLSFEYYTHFLDHFFHKNTENGRYIPKTIQVQISEKDILEVP